MKYRIKEYLNNHGDTWYMPQVKRFGFWMSASPYCEVYTMKAAAQRVIDARRTVRKTKPKYHYDV